LRRRPNINGALDLVTAGQFSQLVFRKSHCRYPVELARIFPCSEPLPKPQILRATKTIAARAY
jgi:hypothetical protein